MKIAIIILFLVLLNACDYYDNRLRVINHTNGDITVETYSDTVPEFPSINKTAFYLSKIAAPEDTLNITEIGTNGWPFAIARSKNKRLNLIVYSVDSLRKYQSIDTLINRHIYDRYEFSENELNDKNWTIILR